MGHIAIKKQSYKFNLSCCFTAYCVTCALLETFSKKYKYFKSNLKKGNNFSSFLAILLQYSNTTIVKTAKFCAVFRIKSRFFVVERVEGAKICHLNVTSNRLHFHEFLAYIPKRTSDFGELGQKATHLGWLLN